MFGFFPRPTGIKYTIDLSKITDRANNRTVEAPVRGQYVEPITVDWGDGTIETHTSSSGNWFTHTYGSEVGSEFTITINSETGHFPLVGFNNTYTQAGANNPDYNVTKALVSFDYFDGRSGDETLTTVSPYFNGCSNMKYCDPHITGLPKWRALYQMFSYCSSMDQPLASFCFAFCIANITNTYNGIFNGCSSLTGSIPGDLFAWSTEANGGNASLFADCTGLTGSIPAGLFKNNKKMTTMAYTFARCTGLTGSVPEDLFSDDAGLTHVGYMFYGCSGLDGEPYKFWEKEYASNITSSSYCYSGCSASLRAKVPVAYGGTMVTEA